MLQIKKRSFNDSFLYNKEADAHNKTIIEFILKADRIEDKKADNFRAILEYVRTAQKSSIIYNILLRDDVVLCIGNTELPRAFKVFMAKDVREGKNGAKKVFIDVTGLIKIKPNEGIYVCPKIDILVTYLFQSLGYLLYEYNTLKLINSSNISIAGTECFVSMVSYVIDYMRIIGFEQSKDKIEYLTGLYFLHTMMGKDLDQYTKNIAAKSAGISPQNIKAYDLYYTEGDLLDINTFISFIAKTFKLKGLTTEVFIGKWIQAFLPQSAYATELFTSLAAVLIAAYCGTYVVNQKQIERCCGTSMVKFVTEISKLGTETFENNSLRLEGTNLSRESVLLKESILKRNSVPAEAKFTKNKCTDKALAKSTVKKMIEYYQSTYQVPKISSKVKEAALISIKCLAENASKSGIYDKGTVDLVLDAGSKYLNTKDKQIIGDKINSTLSALEIHNKKVSEKDKNLGKPYREAIIELRKCLVYVK